MDSDVAQRKAQGLRLQQARKAAGFSSARHAALENDWPESTYRAHENGFRTIGQDDAERYARRFRHAGAKISAKAILFGDDQTPRQSIPAVEIPGVTMVPQISWVPASQMTEVEPATLADPDAFVAATTLPRGDWFALQVRGDSMDRIAPDGATILVNRRDQRLVHDRYYVFGHRGQATFKRYIARPTKILMPHSNNPTHEPILPERDFMVIGRVGRVLINV